jgi:lipoate synthase
MNLPYEYGKRQGVEQMLIVIEDLNNTVPGTVVKHTFPDIKFLNDDEIAKVVVLTCGMDATKHNIDEVLSDFNDIGPGPTYNEDRTVAVWHDGVQTDSHFTFLLI